MQGIAQYTLQRKVWALPRDALPAGQTHRSFSYSENLALVAVNFGCSLPPKLSPLTSLIFLRKIDARIKKISAIFSAEIPLIRKTEIFDPQKPWNKISKITKHAMFISDFRICRHRLPL